MKNVNYRNKNFRFSNKINQKDMWTIKIKNKNVNYDNNIVNKYIIP